MNTLIELLNSELAAYSSVSFMITGIAALLLLFGALLLFATLPSSPPISFNRDSSQDLLIDEVLRRNKNESNRKMILFGGILGAFLCAIFCLIWNVCIDLSESDTYVPISLLLAISLVGVSSILGAFVAGVFTIGHRYSIIAGVFTYTLIASFLGALCIGLVVSVVYGFVWGVFSSELDIGDAIGICFENFIPVIAVCGTIIFTFAFVGDEVSGTLQKEESRLEKERNELKSKYFPN